MWHGYSRRAREPMLPSNVYACALLATVAQSIAAIPSNCPRDCEETQDVCTSPGDS